MAVRGRWIRTHVQLQPTHVRSQAYVFSMDFLPNSQGNLDGAETKYISVTLITPFYNPNPETF